MWFTPTVLWWRRDAWVGEYPIKKITSVSSVIQYRTTYWNNKVFSNLMELITSRENIKLAYRSIKGNKGSHTAGVDGRTIKHLSKLNEEEYISLIQKQFHWYKPRPVKRVEMRKSNGKIRPLGIPTIVDRIVQQCILQILEPICEAKFHDSS